MDRDFRPPSRWSAELLEACDKLRAVRQPSSIEAVGCRESEISYALTRELEILDDWRAEYALAHGIPPKDAGRLGMNEFDTVAREVRDRLVAVFERKGRYVPDSGK
jgi:hypothetical protein